MNHSWPDMLSIGTNALFRHSHSDSLLSSRTTHSNDKGNSWKALATVGSSSSIQPTLWLAKPRRALVIVLLLVLSTCMFSSMHLLLRQTSNSSKLGLLEHRGPVSRVISQQNGATRHELGRLDAASAAAAAAQAAAVEPRPQQQNSLVQQLERVLPGLQDAQEQQKQQQQQRQAGPARIGWQRPGLQQDAPQATASPAADVQYDSTSIQLQPSQHPDLTADKHQLGNGGVSQQHQHQQQSVSGTDQHSSQQLHSEVASVLVPASVVAAGTGSSPEAVRSTSPDVTAAAPSNAAAAAARDDSTSVYITARGVAPTRLQYPVWWHGPVWSGSGYGSEAINYVLSLLRTGRLAPADIWVANHGDMARDHVVESMAPADRSDLQYLEAMPDKYRGSSRAAVVVCHSMATNWAYPEPMWSAGAQCPPAPREYGWVYSIGRTMFETDRLPGLFVTRLNAMNEIWVPSEWQKASFIASGVSADKLVVVPEGINTTLYDPAAYTPMDLAARAQLVFGRPWEDKVAEKQKRQLKQGSKQQQQQQQQALQQDVKQTPMSNSSSSSSEAQIGDILQQQQQQNKNRKKFTFISSFKWEQRKGWDILLQAYLSEFTIDDNVELYILTKPYESSGTSFKEKMRSWADKMYGSTSSYDNAWEAARVKGQLPVQQGRLLKRSPDVRRQGLNLSDASLVTGDSPNLAKSATRGSGRLSAVLGSGPGVAALVPKKQPAPDRRQLLQQGQEEGQVITTMQQHQRPGFELCDGSQWHGSVNCTWSRGPVPHRQRQQRRRSLQTSIDITLPGFGQTGPATTDPESSSSSSSSSSNGGSISAADVIAAAAERAAAQYPTMYVVDSHISDADFPRFYKAGDAFVLPSRGEGWGRPHVEAMSMGLPVISTNWSGITAYLDDKVGYPIAVEKLVQIQGGSDIVWWFRGQKWAQPSVKHLRQLMRRVYENREEAAAKGAAARALMVEKYSPEAIADILVKEFERIEKLIP